MTELSSLVDGKRTQSTPTTIVMTSRKTQQEIDKTFKKIAEGIQTFESIYEKVKTATNPTQRDKLEENLKREIKKLQRFRDQIKSWAAGNEVKDKAPQTLRYSVRIEGTKINSTRDWAYEPSILFSIPLPA